MNHTALLGYGFCGTDAVDNNKVVFDVEDVHPPPVVAHHPPCLGVILPYVSHRTWTVQFGENRQRHHFGNHRFEIPASTLYAYYSQQEFRQFLDIVLCFAGYPNRVVSHTSPDSDSTPSQNIRPPTSIRYQGFSALQSAWWQRPLQHAVTEVLVLFPWYRYMLLLFSYGYYIRLAKVQILFGLAIFFFSSFVAHWA